MKKTKKLDKSNNIWYTIDTMPEIELYDSVTHSNMPAKDKSNVLALLADGLSGKSDQTVLGAALEMSIVGLTSAILGVADAELKDGLDYNKKYPLDLILASTACVTGVIFKSKVSQEVSKTAFGVYSFRSISGLLKALKTPDETTGEEVSSGQQAAE